MVLLRSWCIRLGLDGGCVDTLVVGTITSNNQVCDLDVATFRPWYLASCRALRTTRRRKRYISRCGLILSECRVTPTRALSTCLRAHSRRRGPIGTYFNFFHILAGSPPRARQPRSSSIRYCSLYLKALMCVSDCVCTGRVQGGFLFKNLSNTSTQHNYVPIKFPITKVLLKTN